MRRFVFKSLLRKLPLFAVLTVTLASVAIIPAASTNFVTFDYGYGYHEFVQGSTPTGYLELMIFYFFIMLVLPLFSMSYRFSLAKSDAYRQAAFKDKSIRYAEHISTLVTVLISFTFAYAILVGLLAIRNYSATVPTYYMRDGHYSIGYLHYFYYLPMYFAFIVGGVAQYFISYLLVSRCNCLRNSVIVLIMGQLLLFSFTGVIFSYIKEYYGANYDFVKYSGASVALPAMLISETFDKSILYGEPLFSHLNVGGSYVGATLLIILTVLFFSIAVLGVIAFIIEKDPSGEFAGKSTTKKPYQEIIFHAGFAFFGAYLGSAMLSMDLLSYFLFLVIFAAAYYPLYGTLLRNFKLKPYQIAIMAGVVMFIIVVSISVKSVNSYDYN